jgi:RimJ/RimL family protein N-acetyltransferase
MENERPVVTIFGERVALGPLRPELYSLHTRWVNDSEVGWNIFGLPQTRTLQQESEWLDLQLQDPHSLFYLIYAQDRWRPIGVTSLSEIDFRRGTASYRIMIGEAGDRGKGYGTEVTRLMLEHAFSVLGLHNIMLKVFGFNVAGQRAYLKAGFRVIGNRRECVPRDGKLWDEVFMECLATEFTPLPSSDNGTIISW